MATYTPIELPMTVASDTPTLSMTVAGNLVIGGHVPVLQTKTVYPSSSDQTIEPDTGYDALDEVDVMAVVVTNLSAANIVDGVTVNVGDANDDDSIASVTGTAQTGIVPTGTLELTSNGTENCSAYEYVDVDVANSYTAGDEGKVVRSGELVSQSSATYTQNNTYDTTLVNSVTVQVEGGGGATLGTKTVNANGTYKAEDDALDGYSQVTVNVPASAVDTGTKSITANGNNQDVVGYAAVNVNVPNSYSAGDEGKVVSSGALVSQTAHADVTPTTSDQTIDTTTNNSIKVKGDADLIASNIKKDVTIFSVTGSYEGGGVSWDDIATGSQPTGLITINANSIRGTQMTFEPLNNWKIYAPNVESNSNGSGLRGARNCTHAAFPKLTSMGSGYFCYQSYELQVIDLGLVSSIINTSFIQCSALETIILRKSDGLTTLGNVNNFNNTKFANGGAGGTIYIPKTLYDHLGDGTSLDYKAASNWSTIDGYGTITWAKIEGSIYEATDWILSV